MLTAADVAEGRRTRRSMPSLRQQYDEYIFQRIEGHKESLSCAQLLTLADEAIQDLHAGTEQFVLTEVLASDQVDQLIKKRLRLPSFRKWRQQIHARREAQRQPIHWGIDPESALIPLLRRIETDDPILMIGQGLHLEACLLAAWGGAILFVDDDREAVDRLEARIQSESLGGRFIAFVAAFQDGLFGKYLPPCDRAAMVAIDAGTLKALDYERRRILLDLAQARTAPGGIHVLLPGETGAVPEAYVSHYPGWEREAPPGRSKGRAPRLKGVVLRRRVEIPSEPARAEAS